ncbi:AMP-binding protein [Chitinophaga pinensis]|uniref:AMP-binding protein n=1 Tax=Chitinophaga pinensis TaxID=79329 RepID=A0A5C6LRG7_9BACT|nr:AMP-binding protein [Chitinophaga pinensis]
MILQTNLPDCWPITAFVRYYSRACCRSFSGNALLLLAIVKAGATYLPLDPEYPQARIEFMLQDAGAAYLITSEKYSDRFQTMAKNILMEDLLRQAPQYDVTPPDVMITMQDVVYVLYTSGSTGQPKGVQITQLGLVNS